MKCTLVVSDEKSLEEDGKAELWVESEGIKESKMIMWSMEGNGCQYRGVAGIWDRYLMKIESLFIFFIILQKILNSAIKFLVLP